MYSTQQLHQVCPISPMRFRHHKVQFVILIKISSLISCFITTAGRSVYPTRISLRRLVDRNVGLDVVRVTRRAHIKGLLVERGVDICFTTFSSLTVDTQTGHIDTRQDAQIGYIDRIHRQDTQTGYIDRIHTGYIDRIHTGYIDRKLEVNNRKKN